MTPEGAAARDGPRGFRPGEVAAIAAAAGRAPSVHNTQPWLLEFGSRRVSVFERADLAVPRHDLFGRDRLISCGAALGTARVAIRRFGRRARLRPFPDPGRHAEVGRVDAGAPLAPTERELARFRAVWSRHSHRLPFAPEPVAGDLLREVIRGCAHPGVQIRIVGGDLSPRALAELLGPAARAIRGDADYQRELARWTAGPASRDGFLPAPAENRSLPWAGLVDGDTTVPDVSRLADRLAAETQILLSTVGDGRSDHLTAGIALQDLWLDLTARGLAAAVSTQLLHSAPVRDGLAALLDLAGHPQLLVRVGHPAGVARSSARRPLSEVVRLTRVTGD